MTGDKKRVVVDTNILVSAILFPRGFPYSLLNRGIAKQFDLIISDKLFDELHETLTDASMMKRYALDTESVEKDLLLIKTISSFVSIKLSSDISIRDPKDEMVLMTALSGEAHYLLTGDKDLLVIRRDPKLKHLTITTVKNFLQREFNENT